MARPGRARCLRAKPWIPKIQSTSPCPHSRQSRHWGVRIAGRSMSEISSTRQPLQGSRLVLHIVTAALASCLLGNSAECSNLPKTIQGRARVVDGDTLQVDGKRLRLFAIDAPELKQTCADKRGSDYACGRAAARALQAAVGHSPVLCTSRQLDQYGRTVAECLNRKRQDLGHLMVAKGHAIAYRWRRKLVLCADNLKAIWKAGLCWRYSNKYVLDETKAKQQKLGIWDGSFDWPATWRKKQQELQSDKSDL